MPPGWSCDHTGTLEWDPACFGYTIGAKGDDLSFDERDSAPFVPKSVVIDPNFDWHGEPRRRFIPWEHTVIYEAHVKGFTKRHPAVPEHLRGTYPGLGVKEVAQAARNGSATSTPMPSTIRRCRFLSVRSTASQAARCCCSKCTHSPAGVNERSVRVFLRA